MHKNISISNNIEFSHMRDDAKRAVSNDMVRSTLLPVTSGRQIGLGGVPPPSVLETPLTSDISGPC